MLNRDTWSNKALRKAVQAKFILWQVCEALPQARFQHNLPYLQPAS